MKKFLTVLSVVLMVMLSCVPVFAEDDGIEPYNVTDPNLLPNPATVWDTSLYNYAVIVSTGGQTKLYLVATKPYLNGSGFLTAAAVESGNTYQVYKHNQASNVWGFEADSTSNFSKSGSLIWSSYDILYKDGSVAFAHDSSVFSITLPERIQEVVTEELTGTTLPTIVGWIATLALCGVGCLSLWMLVMLLHKVFRAYTN